ncbi:BCCT family transporter [Marinomonas primoryensis]|uniref:BCCT family transporter n=1 Tax=Marinomonas primoryensis TaxID=178399 RepID=A0ABV0L3C8_9GAMM
MLFLISLAFSHYGNIRLGADDSRPDYSNLTWWYGPFLLCRGLLWLTFFYHHNLPMRISNLFYPILWERAFSPGAGQ